MYRHLRSGWRIAALCICTAMLAGCGGAFGTSDTTSPGSTPNIAAQTSYRVVGDIGTPFLAIVSDARSSWRVYGTIPMSFVIINGISPDRIMVTKLTNDSRLLSVEIISGFTVKVLSSTVSPYGVAVGGINGVQKFFAPPASPDVRFIIKTPYTGIFNALIEDISSGSTLQSRAPCVILFDSPNGNKGNSGRVDGTFTQVSEFQGLDIDLMVNGVLKQTLTGGPTLTLKSEASP